MSANVAEVKIDVRSVNHDTPYLLGQILSRKH